MLRDVNIGPRYRRTLDCNVPVGRTAGAGIFLQRVGARREREFPRERRRGLRSRRNRKGGNAMTTDAATTGAVVEGLRSHPFFAGFEPAYLDALAGMAKPARFGANHVILQQGEQSAQLYLITSGRVALEISGLGQPFRVDTLGAGDEFGWSWALGNPGVYQVRALEPVDALVLAASALSTRCEEDSAFGYALMRRLLGVVAERLQATRLNVIDMYLPAARRAGA